MFFYCSLYFTLTLLNHFEHIADSVSYLLNGCSYPFHFVVVSFSHLIWCVSLGFDCISKDCVCMMLKRARFNDQTFSESPLLQLKPRCRFQLYSHFIGFFFFSSFICADFCRFTQIFTT